MTAHAIDMHDFIEALRIRVPRDLHPSSRCIIHQQFGEMHVTADDPAHVAKLAAAICHRIVSELRWEAVKSDAVHDVREAYRLRRQADRIEASHG